MEGKEQKRHQQKQSGRKAEKKKRKQLDQGAELEQDERKRNPKAFGVHSAVRMARTFHRSALTFIMYIGHIF